MYQDFYRICANTDKNSQNFSSDNDILIKFEKSNITDIIHTDKI